MNSAPLTPEERRLRVRELFAGLDEHELAAAIRNLREDMDEEARRQKYVDALLRERDAYAKRGNEGGIADVNEALAHHGYEAQPPAKRAERRPAVQRAEQR